MPTIPLFKTVKNDAADGPVIESTPPVPVWARVRSVLVELEAIVSGSSLRSKASESRPSSVSATKADGTAPMRLRGVISESQTEGVLLPPMEILKYRSRLKSNVDKLVMLPRSTLKSPLVTVTGVVVEVCVSVQREVPPKDAVYSL